MDLFENSLREALLRRPKPPAHLPSKVMARIAIKERRSLLPSCLKVPNASMPYLSLIASVVVLLASIGTIVIVEKTVNAPHNLLESADGPTYLVSAGVPHVIAAGQNVGLGKTVRSEGGAQLRLADGSIVELRSHSEITLQSANDGVRLQLSGGSVIVTAAKQRNGHLYVRTKDVTVSVVGTVFFVSAEELGSRVGVIQGVVSVQQGTSSKTLLPGQQVATRPTMPEVTPLSEISWSHHVPLYSALLEQIPTVSAPASASQNAGRPEDTPKWEVVSVKPCVSDLGTRGGGVTISPGRATWTCQVLEGLVNAAYLIAPRGMGARLDSPITGGPSWIKSDHYTIEAKVDGTATKEMIQGPMLQAILEDRFKLKVHFETKEVPVYALTVGKSGPNLQPFKEGSCVLVDSIKFEEISALIASGEKLCLSYSGPKGASWITQAQGMTLEQFVKIISTSSDRKVINRTGINGRFDFHVEYANPRLLGGPDGTVGVSDAPSIFTAVEQLGLKLEAAKGPGEFLVIDSVERPTEN